MSNETPLSDGWTKADVEASIERNDPEELLRIPIWVSLDPPDCSWAEAVCHRLSSHPHWNVRGNAILGFGHLARTCGALSENVVRPIIEQGLQDKNDYVRGHSVDAADDVIHFLGWKVSGYSQATLDS